MLMISASVVKGRLQLFFTAVHCIFEVLALIAQTNVITLKMQCSAVKEFVNCMLQLGFD